MRFVHGHRRETALKQMPRPAAPCIDEIGIAAMGFAHRTAQPIRVPRVQDQVHMVWHQAVSPHLHVRLARLLPKKVPVNLLIAVSVAFWPSRRRVEEWVCVCQEARTVCVHDRFKWTRLVGGSVC